MAELIETSEYVLKRVDKNTIAATGWKGILFLVGAILAVFALLVGSILSLILFTGNNGSNSFSSDEGIPPSLKTIYEEIGGKYGIPWYVLAAIHQLDPSYRMDMMSVQPVDGQYAQYFNAAGTKYGVDPALLKAIAKQESSFNPKTISPAGAEGIMQLMPENCRAAGLIPGSTCLDPEKNIFAGAKEISRYLEDFNGNLTLALAAYNAGEGNVKKYNGVPPFKETQDYVKKVPVYYAQFKSEVASTNGNSLEQVEKKITQIAETLQKYKAEHENSIKQGHPTACMAALNRKSVLEIKEGRAGSFGALSCAIYSYKSSWPLVAQIESQAQALFSPAGTLTYTGGKFPWPTQGRVSAPFGENRGNHYHGGIDIAAPSGTPIYAPADGVVNISKADPGGFGWYIGINHGGGLETWYGHVYPNQVFVKVGQHVKKGQEIALVGNNGHSTGSHLHFEVHVKGQREDPMLWLR